MPNNAFEISTDKARLDIDMIHSFLQQHAAWSKGISLETVVHSIERSLCFGAYLGTTQIGFAGVVTDMATFGYRCDVFVLPQY